MLIKRVLPEGGLVARGGGIIRNAGGLMGETFGVRTLYNLDFSSPVTAFDFSSAYADDQWLMQEGSGTYTNDLGGTALTNNGGNGLMGQIAVGLYNGSDYSSRKAWEVRPGAGDGTDYLHTSSDTATLDCDNEDVCIVIVFRCPKATTGTIFSKRGAVGEGYAGYSLYGSGSGWITFCVDEGDGVNQFTQALATPYDDGAWHVAKLWYDHSAKELHGKTELNSFANVATGLTGSLTNSGEFEVGRWTGGSSTASPNLQVAYVGGCTGANAEAMYNEAVVLPGTDPTGKLVTKTRASAIAYWVGDGYVNTFSKNTTPIVWEPALASGAGGYGLLCNMATTNLVPYSDLSTGATETNCSSTDGYADAPDGQRTATLLTASSNGGFQEKVCVTVASTAYCGSVFIKESTVGVTGTVELYDLSNGATIGNTPFTATSSWQRVEIAGSTIAGGISTGLRVTIDTSAETVLVWGAQLEKGDAASHYIRTIGASAASAAHDFDSPFLISNALGELRVVSVWHNFIGAAEEHIYNAISSVGNQNRRRMFYDASNRWKMYPYDAAGALEDANVVVNSGVRTEVISRHIWDQSVDGAETGGYEHVGVYNGTTTNGAASPWDGTIGEGGSAVSTIEIGHVGGAQQMNGVIQSIASYNGPVEEIP